MSLKRIREARGLNPRELAELSGVHVVKIYQIEAEKIKPENIRLKNAVRLARALNCRCEDLLEDAEDARDTLGHWADGYCDKCGGRIKPDVVLYEEGLDMSIMNRAVSYIENAEVLIIGGTSLVVYPAAGLIDYFNRGKGHKLILINKSATARDAGADLVITDPIGEVFDRIRV